MTRADLLLFALLAVALAEASVLGWRSTQTPAVVLPMLLPGEAPEAIFSAGGAEARLRARAVAIGDYVTIEDLSRGALALSSAGGSSAGGSSDGLPGVRPLSTEEKAALLPLIASANEHRESLLQNERDATAAEAALDAASLRIVVALSPEQRAWVLAHRDEVSVGAVEAGYWAELRGALSAESPPPP